MPHNREAFFYVLCDNPSIWVLKQSVQLRVNFIDNHS